MFLYNRAFEVSDPICKNQSIFLISVYLCMMLFVFGKHFWSDCLKGEVMGTTAAQRQEDLTCKSQSIFLILHVWCCFVFEKHFWSDFQKGGALFRTTAAPWEEEEGQLICKNLSLINLFYQCACMMLICKSQSIFFISSILFFLPFFLPLNQPLK